MLRITLNGIEKEFEDLWECRWAVEEEVEVDENYIEDLVNGFYPKVEIMGIEFEPFEVIKECAEWKIDELIDEEKNYIVDEIMAEIELSDNDEEIDRFSSMVKIHVIAND